MSGGSYDYLCVAIRNGDIDALGRFERDAEQLAEDLSLTAQRLRAGEVQAFSTDRGFFPYPTADEAAYDAEVAAARVRLLAAKIVDLQKEVAALADVAQAVEWCASGDWSDDSVADACIALAADPIIGGDKLAAWLGANLAVAGSLAEANRRGYQDGYSDGYANGWGDACNSRAGG